MATTLWATTVNATTIKKNSGILRYQIGTNDPGAPTTTPAAALAGGSAYVVNCLGDDGVTTPDMDNQLFGNTVGYAGFSGNVNSIFANLASSGAIAAASQPTAVNPYGNGAGVRFPPASAGSGTATGQARLQANARINAGTKVMAWFSPTSITEGGSTTPQEVPLAMVQIQYIFGVPYIASTAQTGQEQYLTFLRVGVQNASSSGLNLVGCLYVQVMHSLLDIPGLTGTASAQNIIPSILG